MRLDFLKVLYILSIENGSDSFRGQSNQCVVCESNQRLLRQPTHSPDSSDDLTGLLPINFVGNNETVGPIKGVKDPVEESDGKPVMSTGIELLHHNRTHIKEGYARCVFQGRDGYAPIEEGNVNGRIEQDLNEQPGHRRRGCSLFL